MRILITGASGLLGSDVWVVLSQKNYELFGLGREESPDFIARQQWIRLDLTQAQATYTAITKINPDLVIHIAAFTDVDECQRYSEQAYSVNALATRNIALACQRFDTVLLYISTDYVFDGKNPPAKGYREMDNPNPISEYARSKYWGECFVRHFLNKFYIVRTAWLFGQSKTNLVTNIVEKIKKEKVLSIVGDQLGCPTYTQDLAKAIGQLIETNLFGIYHLTNSGFCSRIELAREIVKIMGIRDIEMKSLKWSDLDKSLARRPDNSVLENFCWRISGFRPLRHWKEALGEYLANLNT